MNSAEYRQLQVRQYERERAALMSPHDSIAEGFAWRAANVGGVWRHFKGLEKYSSLPIALYPSPYACEMLQPGCERDAHRRIAVSRTAKAHFEKLGEGHCDWIYNGIGPADRLETRQASARHERISPANAMRAGSGKSSSHWPKMRRGPARKKFSAMVTAGSGIIPPDDAHETI